MNNATQLQELTQAAQEYERFFKLVKVSRENLCLEIETLEGDCLAVSVGVEGWSIYRRENSGQEHDSRPYQENDSRENTFETFEQAGCCISKTFKQLWQERLFDKLNRLGDTK